MCKPYAKLYIYSRWFDAAPVFVFVHKQETSESRLPAVLHNYLDREREDI